MPFDAAPVVRSPLPDNIAGQSALVLDMVEFYFDGGKRWARGGWWADGERRCLTEAVQFVRHETGRRDDRATDYLARAIRATGFTLNFEPPLLKHIPEERAAAVALVVCFNDARHRHYSEIAAAVRTAKGLAEADAWAEAASNAI